jgi:hypothetical protein
MRHRLSGLVSELMDPLQRVISQTQRFCTVKGLRRGMHGRHGEAWGREDQNAEYVSMHVIGSVRCRRQVVGSQAHSPCKPITLGPSILETSGKSIYGGVVSSLTVVVLLPMYLEAVLFDAQFIVLDLHVQDAD